MKVKTSNLSGKALDWAVIKSSNFPVMESEGKYVSFHEELGDFVLVKPSDLWSQCGTMIKRFGMTVCPADSENNSFSARFYQDGIEYSGMGGTPQIAICRAVVALHLGDEIELPEGLVNGLD